MESSRLLVFLGISFTTITAAVAYLLFRKDEEVDPDSGIRSSRRTVIKVSVPVECMGTVIGRGGCNIQSIQQKTGARINCGDQDRSEKIRIVTISGNPEAAQLAESMIHEIITNQPLVITHEMWVPVRACGRIIGKSGETIRTITRSSCAKVIVDSAGDDERSMERRVLLKGTAEQIALAKSLIEEKVEEDADHRRRVEMSIAHRSPRREPRDNLNRLLAPSDNGEEHALIRRNERLNISGSDGFFDVFVSALNNPSQFWVQQISSKGVELDQLVDKMTEYYSIPENKENHALGEINVGQIVAAPFDHDQKWYRAEVLKIEEDEYDAAESRVTLYYADYGDSCVVRRKNVCDLRTDFLSLYFQAIECILAHVKPSGGEWSDEAIGLFEESAEVAMWRKKTAHVVTYRDGSQERGQRAGSPIPVIELHDMEKGMNIGEELVKQGFAVWESSSPPLETPGSSSGTDSLMKDSNNPELISKSNSSTDNVELPNPSKVSPAAVFESNSTSDTKNFQVISASSLINKAKKLKAESKFIPKTLGSTEKKQKTEKKEMVVLPESFSSDDEDGFGFTLE